MQNKKKHVNLQKLLIMIENVTPSTSLPILEKAVNKKAWISPELILIDKDCIEANNPFSEDNHILS